LATDRRVAASTQNQALAALLFTYRDVLGMPFVKVDSLWSAALLDREPDDRNATVSYGAREVRRAPQQPTILHIWIQAVASTGDSRGSFYFVYDAASATLLRAGLGQPEWSPRSTVVEVRPRMFFRLSGDAQVYLLAEYGDAWEDYSGGWAILDAATGRLIARSS